MTECQKCHKEGKITLKWGVVGAMKFVCPDCSRECKSCKQQLSEYEQTSDFGRTFVKGLMCTNKKCELRHKQQNDEAVK